MNKLIVLCGLLAVGATFVQPDPEGGSHFCVHDGRVYEHDETWKERCVECRCDAGRVKCDNMLCPSCVYMGLDGSTKRSWGEYHDGCNYCLCTHEGYSLCTSMFCPHKCQASNDDGAVGWVDAGTILIRMPVEEGNCPMVCTCVKEDKYYGASAMTCEEKC